MLGLRFWRSRVHARSYVLPALPKVPKILYEDDDLVGVFKPVGWHCTSMNNDKASLGEWLLNSLHIHPTEHAFTSDFIKDGGLASRLDCATGGIIISSKNEKTYRVMLDQVRSYYGQIRNASSLKLDCNSSVGRTFIAYSKISPIPEPPHAICDSWFLSTPASQVQKLIESVPITQHPNPNQVRVKFSISTNYEPKGPKNFRVKLVACPSDKKAKVRSFTTNLEVIQRISKDCIISRVTISKGFRHQLRVHLAALGLPLWGEQVYLNSIPDYRPIIQNHELPLGLYCVGVSYLNVPKNIFQRIFLEEFIRFFPKFKDSCENVNHMVKSLND